MADISENEKEIVVIYGLRQSPLLLQKFVIMEMMQRSAPTWAERNYSKKILRIKL